VIIKCPECQTANTSDSQFCKKCATPLPSSGGVFYTKTLETPIRRLKIGSIFAGRYKILEELGKGGMGEVYKVKDEKLDEEMALKVLKPEIAADKDIIERFKNELKFARKIAHRHVCKMYDLNEEEEIPYITMEYVRGEDLKSFIRRKEKLKEEEVIDLAKRVCEGLAEAHELGVVHRDLKPQNIMIDEKSNAKVMDFGIARSVEAAGVTQTGVMIGTPDYMSPEQAEGEEADQRSDIYALGVIMYEMVTGGVPFKGDTAFSVALKHKTKLPSDPKKLNPDISENLSRLILICMEKERERRYQTAETLLADLRNIEEGLPLGTKIRSRRETFFATLIRKKLFIPAVVIVLAIIAVVVWQLLPLKEAVPSVSSGKPSLAVVYFKNNTGDEALDHWRTMISDLFIADLTQSKHIEVLSSERLLDILSKLNQLEAKSYSSDVLKQVASKGGVEHILVGNYAKAGDTIRINVALQEADTGKILGSEGAEGIGDESIFSMVDELTRRIKANFKLTPKEIAEDVDKDILKITTSSPEAFKYYSEGKKYLLQADYNKGIQLLERAVAIDPEFAMAYRSIAAAYISQGYLAEGKKNLHKALELSDRISDRERYLIQGHLYRLSEKTYDKAIQAFEKLLQLYPEDLLGNFHLGRLYLSIEEMDKAIKHFELNTQKNPENHIYYYYLADSYMGKNHYDKAKEILEDYLRNYSDSYWTRQKLALNYLHQGKYDLALAEADKGILLNPASPINFRMKGDIFHCKGDLNKAEEEFRRLLEQKEPTVINYGRGGLATLYLLKGKLEESINQFKLGLELAKTIGEKSWESLYHQRLSYVYLKIGNPEEAIKELDLSWRISVEEESLSGQRSVLLNKGIVYISVRSLDKALQAAEGLKGMIEEGMNKKRMRSYFYLMGNVELKRENFSKAIEYLKKALSLTAYGPLTKNGSYINSLALAYYNSGELEKAQQEYERIISLTTGRLNYGDIYAKSFYMLGKIYEQQGKTAKAIEHYEKFLSLWKDADPGFPEVENARKRLAGLQQWT